jgi:hypothetical protein
LQRLAFFRCYCFQKNLHGISLNRIFAPRQDSRDITSFRIETVASYLNAIMPRDTSIRSVLIIGSGPIVIGQACEFDYSGSQAALSLKEEGISVSIINSNPATIMTDEIIADHIYLRPLTVDSIEQILIGWTDRAKPL